MTTSALKAVDRSERQDLADDRKRAAHLLLRQEALGRELRAVQERETELDEAAERGEGGSGNRTRRRRCGEGSRARPRRAPETMRHVGPRRAISPGPRP